MSDWQTVLEPTPECIDIARLDAELTPAERTHLESCARCQTELALFRDVMSEESSPESQWIAEQLKQKNNVVAFRPKVWRALYAVAAVLVLIIGISTWMQMREPSIDLTAGPDAYRSGRLELVAPIGDVAQAPNELRWTRVSQATRYHVRIVEVDATPVWSSDTTQSLVVLPPDVIAQFAPGKSLRWTVQAFRGNEEVAVSETQTIRVTP